MVFLSEQDYIHGSSPRVPTYCGTAEVCMWTISHFPSTFWRTDVNLPFTVCGDPSGGRILRMKCPVQSAASSPSKSMRPCLGTSETLPGGRLRSPLKLPSTSGQPFIRRGSEVEKLLVFPDLRNRDPSSSVSAVLRAWPNRRTVAATSALIASAGSVVGDGVGSTVTVPVPATGDYADGLLGAGESFNIIFVIGLVTQAAFDFFVNGTGIVNP